MTAGPPSHTPGAQPGGAVPAPAPRAPVTAHREARWIPPIVLLAVLLFVVFGGFVIAGEPGAAGTEITGGGEPGAPITVTEGVTITPAPGWTLIEQFQDGVRLAGGTGQLLVLAQGSGTPSDVLSAYVAEVLEPQSSQLSVSEFEVGTLPSGLNAARASYAGVFEGADAPLEGEITGVVSASATAVLFDGWSVEGQFGGIREDVRAMVDSARVT